MADVQNRLNNQGFILDQLGSSVQSQEDRLTTRLTSQLVKEREDLRNELRASMVHMMSDLADIKDRLVDTSAHHASSGHSQIKYKCDVTSEKDPISHNTGASVIRGNQPAFGFTKSEHDSDLKSERNRAVDLNLCEEQSTVNDQLSHLMSQLKHLNTNLISCLQSNSNDVFEKANNNFKKEIKYTLKEVEANIVDKIIQHDNERRTELCEAVRKNMISIKQETQLQNNKIKQEILDQLCARAQFGEIHRDMEKQLDIMREVKSELKGNFTNISFVLRLLIFLLPVFLVLLPWAPVLSQGGIKSEKVDICTKFEQFALDFEHITKDTYLVKKLSETAVRVKTSLDELTSIYSHMEEMKNYNPEVSSVQVMDNIHKEFKVGIEKHVYPLFLESKNILDTIKGKLGTITDDGRSMIDYLKKYSSDNKDEIFATLKEFQNAIKHIVANATKATILESNQDKNKHNISNDYLSNSNIFYEMQKSMNINLKHELHQLKSELLLILSDKIEKQITLHEKSLPLPGDTGDRQDSSIDIQSDSDKSVHHSDKFYKASFGDTNQTFNASLEFRNELKDIRKELKALRIGLKSQFQSAIGSFKIGLDESTAILTETQTEFLSVLQGDLDKHLQYLFRDLTEVMEKEGQLMRELNHETDTYNRNVYQFYFPVKLFKQRVKSGVWVISCPWYVQQFDTSLRGNVKFNADGTLGVWMVFGRYPNRVGLLPRQPVTFYYKVSVVDEDDNREKILGESPLGYLDEVGQKIRFDALAIDGWKMLCLELQEMGFVKLDTLVIKYVLVVKPSGISREMLTPNPKDHIDSLKEEDPLRGPVPSTQ